MKIKHYTTATCDNTKGLDQAVNELISKGFQPYGNPYLSDQPIPGVVDTMLFAQAMVKYDSSEGVGAAVG
jgi:hypothetical protein